MVNRSFYSPDQTALDHRCLGWEINLQYHKTITLVTPAYYSGVRWIFEHSVPSINILHYCALRPRLSLARRLPTCTVSAPSISRQCLHSIRVPWFACTHEIARIICASNPPNLTPFHGSESRLGVDTDMQLSRTIFNQVFKSSRSSSLAMFGLRRILPNRTGQVICCKIPGKSP